MFASPLDAVRSLALPMFLFASAVTMTACGVGAVNDAAPATSEAQTTSQGTSQTGTSQGGGTTSATNSNTAVAPDPNTASATNPNATNANTTTSTPQASATFTGSVDGQSLQAKSAIFAVVTGSDGTQTLAVKLSDQAGDCNEVTNNAHKANSNSFWLRAVGSTFANASFTLSGQNADSGTPSATFYALDSSCDGTLPDSASWAESGNVTFTAVSAQTATGTFSASIGQQGDQVSGKFTAAVCPALGTLITSPSATRTCN